MKTADAPLRLPPALRAAIGDRNGASTIAIKRVMRARGLSTVCEEARCPNLAECFASGTATFMILGDRCTRRCHFCSVTTARPRDLDPHEPAKLADAVGQMGLKHVVITSVDRDNLADKGAAHWAQCIRAVKASGAVVEVLTPDFGGDLALVDVVLAAGPDVFNHNLETVARLYRAVRPQSRWEHTTAVLRHVAAAKSATPKSGIMVGLGESDEEVLETLDVMSNLGIQSATIGQYLRPSLAHWPVHRYVDDDSYEKYRAHGAALGIAHVFAGALVRSSYHAAEALRVTRTLRVIQ